MLQRSMPDPIDNMGYLPFTGENSISNASDLSKIYDQTHLLENVFKPTYLGRRMYINLTVCTPALFGLIEDGSIAEMNKNLLYSSQNLDFNYL